MICMAFYFYKYIKFYTEGERKYSYKVSFFLVFCFESFKHLCFFLNFRQNTLIISGTCYVLAWECCGLVFTHSNVFIVLTLPLLILFITKLMLVDRIFYLDNLYLWECFNLYIPLYMIASCSLLKYFFLLSYVCGDILMTLISLGWMYYTRLCGRIPVGMTSMYPAMWSF